MWCWIYHWLLLWTESEDSDLCRVQEAETGLKLRRWSSTLWISASETESYKACCPRVWSVKTCTLTPCVVTCLCLSVNCWRSWFLVDVESVSDEVSTSVGQFCTAGVMSTVGCCVFASMIVCDSQPLVFSLHSYCCADVGAFTFWSYHWYWRSVATRM